MRNIRSILVTSAAIGAAAVGGGAIANAATSNSSSSSNSSGTAASQPAAPRGGPAFNGPAPGTAAHEDAEKAVTGADADKARAAAVKALGAGTAGDVTTNYTGNGYEVTVTKTDGSQVVMHLDSAFNAMPGPVAPAPPSG